VVDGQASFTDGRAATLGLRFVFCGLFAGTGGRHIREGEEIYCRLRTGVPTDAEGRRARHGAAMMYLAQFKIAVSLKLAAIALTPAIG